jgi:hypothetical protein
MLLRFATSLLACSLFAASPGPRFTENGELVRPDDYREWVFLSSGLGMTYGPNAAPGEPRFDNVFVHPEAYRAFLSTGKWPDGTIFALEVRHSASKGSINQNGHFQSGVVAVEFEVKDERRFPQKWAYFGFSNESGTLPKTSPPLKASNSCLACHGTNGAVEHTFVQFYPTLIEVARQKGTLKPGHVETARQ